MGCASSGPLAKNLVDGAKDTAHDVAEMGENALHGASDVAKDGMQHVKVAVESAVHTAEHGLGTVIHKIEDTFGHKKEEAENTASDLKDAVDGLEAATDDAVTKVTEGVTEELSEAETVLASEAEDTKEVLLKKTETIKETVKPVEGNLTIEDMEDVNDDGMGSNVEVGVTKKVEELVARVPTPVHTPPPELKEEPLTPWEKAADAIVNRPIYPSMRNPDVEPDKEPARTAMHAESKLEAIEDVTDDKKIENHTESDTTIEELV